MRKLLDSHSENHEHNKHEHIDIITVKGLKFRYSKKDKVILNDINISIFRGEFTTIIGPNGSGKSTLIKAIVGAHKPFEGTVHVNGQFLSPKDFAKEVAYIPQMIEIPNGLSVRDFVSFGRTPYLGLFGKMSKKDHELVEKAMKTMGVLDWADKNTEDLSGGQRQKVLVAMALAQDTNIVILDEPTTYLDIRAQYELLELMDTLHDMGKTIVVVLHDINQAIQYSDEIIILNNGQVYDFGDPRKVVTQKMLKEVYKIETKLTGKNKKYLSDIKLVNTN